MNTQKIKLDNPLIQKNAIDNNLELKKLFTENLRSNPKSKDTKIELKMQSFFRRIKY